MKKKAGFTPLESIIHVIPACFRRESARRSPTLSERNVKFLPKSAPRHGSASAEAFGDDTFVKRKKFLTGFTLIELLVTVALLGVVSITIYSSFASGIRVWSRISSSLPEEDLAVFYEKMTRELQNTFPYSDIPFQGDEHLCSFPTVIVASEALGANLAVGRVTYFLDDSEEAIGRMQENLSQIYEEKGGQANPALKRVSALSFRYYGYEESESRYVWVEAWDSSKLNGKLPLAVQLNFEFYDGTNTRIITKTISIPVGE